VQVNASSEGRLHSVTLEKFNLITNRNGRCNAEFTRSNCRECPRLFEYTERFSQNSQKRDVEAACLQVQTAPKRLHSLKSSSLRSTSYKQDSSRKRNSSSRITTALEAQARRTASKDGDIIKNPAEALMEHFGNLPSSDITHSSVTESADRLFLWESIPKLGMNSSHVPWPFRRSPNLISDDFEFRGWENNILSRSGTNCLCR